VALPSSSFRALPGCPQGIGLWELARGHGSRKAERRVWRGHRIPREGVGRNILCAPGPSDQARPVDVGVADLWAGQRSFGSCGTGHVAGGTDPLPHQPTSSSGQLRPLQVLFADINDNQTSNVPRVRVLLAEDQFLAREGTVRLLEARPELEMVGVASDYESVLSEARRLQPDVVVMDIKMPPTHSMEGIEAAHILKAERPEVGIVILTQHDDEGYVWALLEAGVAGYGYLHKVRLGDVDQLVRAISEVASGGSVLDPHIVDTLIKARSKKPGSPIAWLTPSELDVLRLMAEGESNQAIANSLFVSIATVEKRISSIFMKLGLREGTEVNRRVAAVLIYLRESSAGY
jgi:DNA-binding NarL/FixJ family response regulator